MFSFTSTRSTPRAPLFTRTWSSALRVDDFFVLCRSFVSLAST
jgi:hypothetical protein